MKYRPHRFLTQYPVEVQTAQGLQRCEVLDVNHAGARLAGMTQTQRGQRVKINILSHNVSAVVLWASADQAGIAFRPVLADYQLDILRRLNRRQQHSGAGRVGFGFAEMR